MKPGQPLARIPGAARGAAGEAAGPDQEEIAGLHAHAGPRFRGLQLVRDDRVARLEPRRAAEARDVEQDAARHDSGGRGVDRIALGSERGHQRAGPAVVHRVAVEDVAEGVQVCDRVAVRAQREVVARGGRLAVEPALDHEVADRKRIVLGGLGRQRS